MRGEVKQGKWEEKAERNREEGRERVMEGKIGGQEGEGGRDEERGMEAWREERIGEDRRGEKMVRKKGIKGEGREEEIGEERKDKKDGRDLCLVK